MRTLTRSLAAGLAIMTTAAMTSAATAHSRHGFDWYGLGGCTLPVIGMNVDFSNVADDVPIAHQSRVVQVGPQGRRQAVLVFVFGGCPTNSLRAQDIFASHDDVTQVMVGVLYQAGTAQDVDKAQFFLLASATDWRRFARAERRLGLPSYYEDGLRLQLRRNQLTGLGSFLVSVPAGPARLTATGQLFAPNPLREFPVDAAHFYKGRRGLVRVHHDETWAAGNAAAGMISAPSGSDVARWMGATTREASGLYYWDHTHQHVHRYALVRRSTTGG